MTAQMPSPQNPLLKMSKEEMLYQLLKKQLGYYKAILELAREEQELMTKPQTLEQIKSILKKKKVLLSCVNEIDEAMRPLKKYWQSKTEKTDPASVRVKHQLEDLNKLLVELLQLDMISHKTMEGHIRNLRTQNVTDKV